MMHNSSQNDHPRKNGFLASCGNCKLAALCPPIALENQGIDQQDDIIQHGYPVCKGEHVFREEDDFSGVYEVRSGVLKTYAVTKNGQEQVIGFYLPGEIFGLDGLCDGRHTNSAKALKASVICKTPFCKLQELGGPGAGLQCNMFHILGQEINYDKQLITLLSKSSADERIAALLVSISARSTRRKLFAQAFRLPMSRTDIGNFLGLTVETVSRTFGRFQKLELIAVDNKDVTLLNQGYLLEVAHGWKASC
jgi:CRP/FNR family transcriptional regulator